jgi:anti-sigma factor RsiW
MTCAALKGVVAAYVDGDLTEAECRSIEEHVEHCEACRALCHESRIVRDAIRRYRSVAPIPQDLMLRTWNRINRHVRTASRVRRYVLAFASLAAVMAIATVSLRTFTLAPVIVGDDGAAMAAYEPVYEQPTTRTHEAYRLVRNKLQANVAPVNLKLVGGELTAVALYDKPARMGRLTYKLQGQLLEYYVSRKKFELRGSKTWVIEGREVRVVHAPTHLSATWDGRDLHYLVTADHNVVEPRGLLTEFIQQHGEF